MPSPYRGSAWRQWDLHVHTPESYCHEFPGATKDEQWQLYLAALETVRGVQVLGITDYCTLEGYRRVRVHFEAGRLPEIHAVLPNIELRLLETTREGKSINIHVIAAPEIVGDLPSLLLGQLRFDHAGELYTCRHEDLVRLGRTYRQDMSLPEAAAFRAGAEQFKVARDHLKEAFEHSDRLRRNAVIALPNRSGDGASGLRESGQGAHRLELYRLADIIISTNPADRQHFLGQDGKTDIFADYGGAKPCIGGSDAHRLEQIGRPAEDRFTWIKADPTFEGLLQICYEPEYRVSIGPALPNEPIHRILSMKTRIPDDAALQGQDGQEPFCLRGERDLQFAPGLTCVIGGRGSGKSTLLSLLQEAVVGRSQFFQEKSILSRGSKLRLGDLVELSVTSSPEGIEFLDQNQIEAFALDTAKLTQAIFSRLEKLDGGGDLKAATAALNGELSALRRLRELVGTRHTQLARLDSLTGQEAAENRLIESLNDATYTTLVDIAGRQNSSMSAMRDAREQLHALARDLEATVGAAETTAQTSLGEHAARSYAARARVLREAVRSAITVATAGEDLSVPSAAEIEVQGELDRISAEISAYLQQRGISEENARDLVSASERLAGVRESILEASRVLSLLDKEVAAVERAPDARARFESALAGLINPVNEQLQERQESELRRISIGYDFDDSAAIESVLLDLIAEESRSQEGARQLRSDHVRAAFNSIAWDNLPATAAALANAIAGEHAGERETVRRLSAHLSQPGAYDRMKLVVQERLTDALRFKRIVVRYDGKHLQEASFGQRCSAALIVLLMLGNQPIVVDEPEAHLDSALIATLLVDLIKRRKSERQIVFATHNANFVVNGDAELVHVLSLDGGEPTYVASTSLEDTNHRPDILRLEGGQAAFAQREQRYGFRGRFSRPVQS